MHKDVHGPRTYKQTHTYLLIHDRARLIQLFLVCPFFSFSFSGHLSEQESVIASNVTVTVKEPTQGVAVVPIATGKMVRAKTRRGRLAKIEKVKKAASAVGSSAKKTKEGLSQNVLGNIANVVSMKRETPSKQKRRRGRPKKTKVPKTSDAPVQKTSTQKIKSSSTPGDTSGGMLGILGSLSGCIKTAAEEDQVFYTTKKDNECVMEIAKRLRVDAQDLVRLNADEWPTLRKRSKLHPGTKLRLPAQYLEHEKKDRERRDDDHDDDASPVFTEVTDFCPLSLFISHSFRQERLQRRGSVRARLVF